MDTKPVASSPTDRLVLSSTSPPNTYTNHEKLNIANDSTSPLSFFYHTSELRQNADIIKTARNIIWAGFCVIALGIIFALLGKADVAILTAISGIITELISGCIFAFVSQSSKSKFQYFSQLSLVEEGDKILAVIGTLNEDAKETEVAKIVDNYCQRRLKS